MTSFLPGLGDRHVPRRSVWIAGVSAGVAVAGLVAAVAVDGGDPLRGHVYEDTITALVWSFLAGLLAIKAPGHPYVRLFLLICCCAAIAVAGSAFAVANPDAAPAAWLGGWIWAVSTFVPMAILPMTFPSGRLRDHRIGGLVVAAGVVLACTGLATTDTIEVTPDLEVHNPIGLEVSDGLFLSGSVLIMLMAVYAVVLLLRRLSGSTGLVRRQFALVAVASVITFAGLTASPLIPEWGR